MGGGKKGVGKRRPTVVGMGGEGVSEVDDVTTDEEGRGDREGGCGCGRTGVGIGVSSVDNVDDEKKDDGDSATTLSSTKSCVCVEEL